LNLNASLTGTLSGGSGSDLFDVAGGTNVSGGIDGGALDTDTLDLASVAGINTVTMTGAGAGSEATIAAVFKVKVFITL